MWVARVAETRNYAITHKYGSGIPRAMYVAMMMNTGREKEMAEDRDCGCTWSGHNCKNHRYAVKVWFATSSSPRVVAVFPDYTIALREARSYLSDAQGVWINDEKVSG